MFAVGGVSFAIGIVLKSTPLDVLLDLEIYKISIGVSVILGWLALPVVTLVFIFNNIMWFIDKAPWYWQSLSPINFSFVLLTVALFNNEPVLFFVPMVLMACAFIIAWSLLYRRLYEDKVLFFSFSALILGSFVLAMALVSEHIESLYFFVPMALETCAFVIAWLLSSRKLYEDKVLVFSFLALVLVSGFFDFRILGYSILLFWGTLLLFIAIIAGSSSAQGGVLSQREPMRNEAEAT